MNYRQWEDDLDVAENAGREGCSLWWLLLAGVLC